MVSPEYATLVSPELTSMVENDEIMLALELKSNLLLSKVVV